MVAVSKLSRRQKKGRGEVYTPRPFFLLKEKLQRVYRPLHEINSLLDLWIE
jgi:hypothetical protein